jgi:hypothetical protein
MKAYKKVEVQFQSFLTSAIDGKWSASSAGHFTPGERAPVAIEELFGWTPELFGWTPELFGWIPELFGWTPELFGWTPELFGWTPEPAPPGRYKTRTVSFHILTNSLFTKYLEQLTATSVYHSTPANALPLSEPKGSR